MYLIKIKKDSVNPTTNKVFYRVVRSELLTNEVCLEHSKVSYNTRTKMLFICTNKHYPAGSFINPRKALWNQ